MRTVDRHAPRQRPPRTQRGITLFGLMSWAIVIGFVAYIGLRVFPTVNEYLTVKRTIDKVAQANPSTVAEVRAAFDRQRDIEYSISSITGKDLQITKENDKVVISVAYDKEIPIYGPVFLVIKYEARSGR